MANIMSEQIKSDLTLVMDFDQPLSTSNMMGRLINLLGFTNCTVEKICNKKVLCYNHGNKNEILLLAAVTYMGGNGQHPVYKKRMQLKKWYKDVVNYYADKPNCNVRFIGVYHYQNNIVLTDFIKDTYIKKKMNSSAAHVYTNDLFQAMKNDIFKRTDRNKNEFVTIKYIKFKDYLDGNLDKNNNGLFSLFSQFNKMFKFGDWISAKKAIPEMHDAGWNKWKETEWPGWYLEYKFDDFIRKNISKNEITYMASSNKKSGQLDFDLWFDVAQFYGDLKASDSEKREAPGNDQNNFIECVNKYGKFWYVIYEHDTVKDSSVDDYDATRFRTNYIREKNAWPKNKPWDELSYCKRMKSAVKFTKMYIIELNAINYRQVLNDFNQGHQPNGDKRKPKFKITKNNIDNFIVYLYECEENN